MKRNRWQENPQGLEPLARQAQDYALHMMRTTGSVPPTVIADTDEGYVFCMPSELTDDAAKDRFAEVTMSAPLTPTLDQSRVQHALGLRRVLSIAMQTSHRPKRISARC